MTERILAIQEQECAALGCIGLDKDMEVLAKDAVRRDPYFLRLLDWARLRDEAVTTNRTL